ncbi:histidine kinase [Streptomyces sp. NPDC000410]|uniref:sensor histidine kinase n=1 Tax=Streptomyces sp. NPDC000410 TaxID=3154254 RepID=UPI00331E4EBF
MLRRDRTREYFYDLALWGLLSTPVLLKLDPADGGSWWQVAAGVLVLGVCVALCRSWPLAALGITVGASMAASVELYTAAYSLALVAFGFLTGWRGESTRSALWSFTAVAAAGLLLVLLSGASLWEWFSVLITVALAIVAPWLIGRYVRQYAQLVRTGWELADRMEREQRAVADRERLRERSRIAGDMHDSLGHELALIAVRAAALEIDRELGPAQQRAAGELRRAAADATARLRDIIGVLRADGEPAPTAPAGETVAHVVERARASGMTVLLEGALPDAAVPPMVDRAVHRVVQEALTNAAKHAPKAPVTITVATDDDSVTVQVTNPPAASPAGPPATSGGTGLVGLDERVRLAGGTLRHGPSADGGFAVTASLPLSGTAVRIEPAEAPTSARELSLARSRVRRGLAQAIWIPAALLGVLAVLIGAFALYSQTHSTLDRTDYDLLHVGDSRADVTTRLPRYQLDGSPDAAPPEPAGMDECVYYRTTDYELTPVYRLCFVGERLASKDVVAEDEG